jgi:hypothetical protein
VSSDSTGSLPSLAEGNSVFFTLSNPSLVKNGAGVIMILTTDRKNRHSVDNKQHFRIFRNTWDLAVVPEASEWLCKAAHQEHSKAGDRPLKSIDWGQRRNRSPCQLGGWSQRERFVLSETGMAAGEPWHGKR